MAARGREAKALEVKVVVLGATGVGKTCLVHRFVRGAFLGPATATIGAAFMKKDVLVGNQLVVLQIWDTAGQERFRSMASMYYRGAHAAVLVFDATQPALHEVENWVGELQQHVPSCALVMAANKSDLPVPEAAALQREASNFAAEIGAQLFATSAKTGQGVEDLFMHIARLMAEQAAQRGGGGGGGGGDGDARVRLEDRRGGGGEAGRRGGCSC